MASNDTTSTGTLREALDRAALLRTTTSGMTTEEKLAALAPDDANDVLGWTAAKNVAAADAAQLATGSFQRGGVGSLASTRRAHEGYKDTARERGAAMNEAAREVDLDARLSERGKVERRDQVRTEQMAQTERVLGEIAAREDDVLAARRATLRAIVEREPAPGRAAGDEAAQTTAAAAVLSAVSDDQLDKLVRAAITAGDPLAAAFLEVAARRLAVANALRLRGLLDSVEGSLRERAMAALRRDPRQLEALVELHALELLAADMQTDRLLALRALREGREPVFASPSADALTPPAPEAAANAA